MKNNYKTQVTARFVALMDFVTDRAILGITMQKEFAEIAGEYGNIGRYLNEKHTRYVTISAIINICEHFKVEYEWMLTGRGIVSKVNTELNEIVTLKVVTNQSQTTTE